MSEELKNVILIAHRGYSGKYPENTLLAYQAAYAFGARWMECDIQLTKDCIPVVHHDENLLRMAGIDCDIRRIPSKQFKQLNAHYPTEFGDAFNGNAFTTLEQLARWIASDHEINMFIEIKQHSIDTFGVAECMQQIFKCIDKITQQVVIISFNDEIVAHAREQYKLANGWVIPEWSDTVRDRALQLQPDYLFINKTRLPENSSEWWQGDWQWAIYNVDEYSELLNWTKKGLHYVETNQIGALLHPKS